MSSHHLQADNIDQALFRLTSLRHLNLSGNNFSMSRLPVTTGFEQRTHLDFSDTNIAGEVPAGIGRLVSVVYLDLSTSFSMVSYDDETSITRFTIDSIWQLSVPNMETLLANLTNLEELHMGMVNMSGNGEQWCNDIGNFTPKLQVLSLPYCSIYS
ncbi:hypothetical protein E2562_016102 [Oryza meyeriana var. granulata]|uniref:Leucine-rich repeat-containing N-terminal plant-type domain-containing protein n=1 Tax=Oryza meyeriana var. granulata TaxID=110450 RepID=A0A6G1BLK9_9ORYZ|nr:hypothetical protein E2562_016102 [Oryza meyeriana var. granulata]